MEIEDLVVQVYAELHPQVDQLSVGVAVHNRQRVIGVKFLPKGNNPITITVPDGVSLILETLRSPVVPQGD